MMGGRQDERRQRDRSEEDRAASVEKSPEHSLQPFHRESRLTRPALR
jgi:hypothetical protein